MHYLSNLSVWESNVGIEEQLLAAAIRDTIAKADQAVAKLYHVTLGNTLDNIDEGAHAEALEEAESTLEFYVEKAFRDISILAERLGLPAFRSDVARTRKSFSKLSSLVPDRNDPGLA
jgi:hypothetical protein